MDWEALDGARERPPVDRHDRPESPSQRLGDALAQAQANHDAAEHNLLAAEEALVRARVALEQARAYLRDAAPAGRAPDSRATAPAPVYHFACGHDGERVVEVGNERVLNLCPSCRERTRRGALSFYQLRGVMVPRP
jgi:hypothetical protein